MTAQPLQPRARLVVQGFALYDLAVTEFVGTAVQVLVLRKASR
jgi:hypothetical protein